jgi:HSP20 family protein
MLARRNQDTTFPKLFSDFFDKELLDWSNSNFSDTNTTLPAVNIKDTKDDYIVEVAAPGMSKKDFKINLKDNLLTIASEKEHKNEDEEEGYTRREYSYQSFSRSFTLPDNIVDSDKITAKYEDGELKITIPKKEEAKPKAPKEIKIK